MMADGYYTHNGKLCRCLLDKDDGMWVILCGEKPVSPYWVCKDELIPADCVGQPQPHSRTGQQIQRQRERTAMLKPLLDSHDAITDTAVRNAIADGIANHAGKSRRTILRLYYCYLAGGADALCPKPTQRCGRLPLDYASNFRWAVRKYHYSSRKIPLTKTYELMLADKYTDGNGVLAAEYPSFSSFRHFYYTHIRNDRSAVISQKGLSYYQRNARPLYGKATDTAKQIGVFEMDATEADVYISSRYDRRQTIGRPILYIAVDRATQLIAGVYVGLKGGDEAVMECLRNASGDKTAFCREYGIEITPGKWPCAGLPGVIVTDRGREFCGSRAQELCDTYGITLDLLPPYRPELKGTVEKSLDLLQSCIRPLLVRHGYIETDFAERGAPDYRLESVLTLEEYTKLVVMAVIKCNTTRVLDSFVRTPEMTAAEIAHTPTALWQWYESNGDSLMKPLPTSDSCLSMLARAQANFTRKGLEFRTLTYRNREYDARCVSAGVSGKESVTVAYQQNDTSRVWLVEDDVYTEFSLTGSFGGFTGLSFDEVSAYLTREKQARCNTKTALMAESVRQVAAMREVVRGAVSEKEGTSPASTLANIDKSREKEILSDES